MKRKINRGLYWCKVGGRKLKTEHLSALGFGWGYYPVSKRRSSSLKVSFSCKWSMVTVPVNVIDSLTDEVTRKGRGRPEKSQRNLFPMLQWFSSTCTGYFLPGCMLYWLFHFPVSVHLHYNPLATTLSAHYEQFAFSCIFRLTLATGLSASHEESSVRSY